MSTKVQYLRWSGPLTLYLRRKYCTSLTWMWTFFVILPRKCLTRLHSIFFRRHTLFVVIYLLFCRLDYSAISGPTLSYLVGKWVILSGCHLCSIFAGNMTRNIALERCWWHYLCSFHCNWLERDAAGWDVVLLSGTIFVFFYDVTSWECDAVEWMECFLCVLYLYFSVLTSWECDVAEWEGALLMGAIFVFFCCN